MSRGLGSCGQYTRPAKPADREARRKWKAGLCDAEGNPLPAPDYGRGRLVARPESEIPQEVLDEIKQCEAQARERESAISLDIFDRDSFLNRRY